MVLGSFKRNSFLYPEASLICMTRYSTKFAQLSYNSSPEVCEFAIEGLCITTMLFQESGEREEPLEIDINKLDPDEKIYYRYQLKKALA